MRKKQAGVKRKTSADDKSQEEMEQITEQRIHEV
jgi:hypothetical protein